MFAGNETRDLVIQHLNGLGNAVNLERNAHLAYDELKWGIEAQDDNGTVRNYEVSCVLTWLTSGSQVKYVYRRVPFFPGIGPSIIRLRDGDRIEFGQGSEGSRLGVGPLPLLVS
jgi:hypothetical protein